MTGGGEAAWAGPQIAGSRGPVAGRPRDPPTRPSLGPERWPPRTASSSGRGAPSCRGGEPRTLRGVGLDPKPSRSWSLNPSVLGRPRGRRAGVGVVQAGAAVNQRSLASLGVGCRLGSGGGEPQLGGVGGPGVRGSGVGRVAIVSVAVEGHLQTASDFVQNSSGVSNSLGGCLLEGWWPQGLGSQSITFLSSLGLPRGSDGRAWGQPAGV